MKIATACLERLIPLSGAGAGLLIGLGYSIGATEDFLELPVPVAESYAEHSSRILLGCQVGVVGAFLALIYSVYLSGAIRSGALGRRSADCVLVGGVGFGVLWLAGFIVHAAGALRADENDWIDPGTAASLSDLSSLLGLAGAPVAAALMVAATAGAALRSRALMPRWFAVVSCVLAIALVVLPINWVASGAFLIWLIVLSAWHVWRPVPTHPSVQEMGALAERVGAKGSPSKDALSDDGGKAAG